MLNDPARALRDGIWMIPAIVIGSRRWYHAPPLDEILKALAEAEASTDDD